MGRRAGGVEGQRKESREETSVWMGWFVIDVIIYGDIGVCIGEGSTLIPGMGM